MLLVVLITVSLACNTPFGEVEEVVTLPTSVDNEPPVVRGVSVDPASGSGSFNAIVTYAHGSDAGSIFCNLSNSGTLALVGSFQVDVPADKNLSDGSGSFSFELTDPGDYSLKCSDANNGQVWTSIHVVGLQGPAEGTEEGPFKPPMWGDWSTADLYLYYKEATTNVPGLDPGHGCWPLNYWAD